MTNEKYFKKHPEEKLSKSLKKNSYTSTVKTPCTIKKCQDYPFCNIRSNGKSPSIKWWTETK